MSDYYRQVRVSSYRPLKWDWAAAWNGDHPDATGWRPLRSWALRAGHRWWRRDERRKARIERQRRRLVASHYNERHPKEAP